MLVMLLKSHGSEFRSDRQKHILFLYRESREDVRAMCNAHRQEAAAAVLFRQERRGRTPVSGPRGEGSTTGTLHALNSRHVTKAYNLQNLRSVKALGLPEQTLDVNHLKNKLEHLRNLSLEGYCGPTEA